MQESYDPVLHASDHGKLSSLMDLLSLLAFLLIYFALQLWVLPRLGVRT